MPQRLTISRFDKRHRIAGAEPKTVPVVGMRSRLIKRKTSQRPARYSASVPNFFATRCKVSGRKWETVCVRTKTKTNQCKKPKIQRTTRMKQIFLYTSLAAMALAVTTTGAAPERCDGTVQLTSQSNVQVPQAGTQPLVQFESTAWHDLSLADGSAPTR